MRSRHHNLVPIALSFVLFGCVNTQTNAPDDVGSGLSAMPSLSTDARVLWREVQDALGGARALEAVHAITATADVQTSQGPMYVSVESHVDGRLRFDQRVDDHRNLAELEPGPDGDLLRSEGREQLEPLDPMLSAYMRGHEFHMIILAPALRFAGGELRPAQEFAGRACDVIEFHDRFDKPLRVFIDRATKLPAGFVMIEPMSEDDAPIEVQLSDWQAFGTLKLFTHAVIEHRGEQFVYEFGELALN